MSRKMKVSPEDRYRAARSVVEGNISVSAAARELGVSPYTFEQWVLMKKENGVSAFLDTGKNKVYPPEMKREAVNAYLSGEGPYGVLAAKYGLRSTCQLKTWVKMYNEGKDFSNKMSGGSRMTTSRKTTKDERIRIVKYCLEHDKNYGEAAVKYDVSYQQVYQ